MPCVNGQETDSPQNSEAHRDMNNKIEFVVHADDFGYSKSVNQCIDKCFAEKWLSETSLMVNMPACDEAVEIARHHGYAHRVGLHLNLTEGEPLTEDIKECPRFCSGGRFNKVFHMSTNGRFFLTRKEKCAVRQEILVQIKKFRAYGGLMMKVDSHHHAHTDLSIYKILKPIALEFGFTSMRISADMHNVRIDKELYKRLYNYDVRKHFKATDHFDGIVPGLIANASGTTEVMVHPLLWDGRLCDSRKDFAENIKQIMTVPNSVIREK